MTRALSPRTAQLRDRPTPPGAFHRDLADAIAREADRDAENVGLFLSELGFLPSADRPVRLPAGFLLQLAAALRLQVWESGGLRVHLDSGLPMAERAMVEAFGLLEESTEGEARHSAELPRKVIGLFADRFAWHGRRDLNSDVVLDDPVDDDLILDALARMIWDGRGTTKPVKETCDE